MKLKFPEGPFIQHSDRMMVSNLIRNQESPKIDTDDFITYFKTISDDNIDKAIGIYYDTNIQELKDVYKEILIDKSLDYQPVKKTTADSPPSKLEEKISERLQINKIKEVILSSDTYGDTNKEKLKNLKQINDYLPSNSIIKGIPLTDKNIEIATKELISELEKNKEISMTDRLLSFRFSSKKESPETDKTPSSSR